MAFRRNSLKWFSGADERRKQAIVIIDELVNELNKATNTKPLQSVLNSYKHELTKKETSIPMILSRMNIDIANVIRKNEILLSNAQSEQLRQLRSISNIRYGY